MPEKSQLAEICRLKLFNEMEIVNWTYIMEVLAQHCLNDFQASGILDLAQLASEITHYLLNDEIQIHPSWAETVTLDRLQSYIEKYQYVLEDTAMRHVFYLEMRKYDDYMTEQQTHDYNNIVD
jgi:hypothetical protein